MNEQRGEETKRDEKKTKTNHMVSDSGTEQRQKEYTGGTIGMVYRREKRYTK